MPEPVAEKYPGFLSGNHFMIDIETLGNEEGAVIFEIGISQMVKDGKMLLFRDGFDACEGGLNVRFELSVWSGFRYGFEMDSDTFAWWLKQDPQMMMRVFQTEYGGGIWEILQAISEALGESPTIWGNGANFDGELLGAYYRKMGMKVPWRYSKSLCYRTLAKLFPGIKLNRVGTHHSALDDAISQAAHWHDLVRCIFGGNSDAWKTGCGGGAES